jgi:hypothetical protein
VRGSNSGIQYSSSTRSGARLPSSSFSSSLPVSTTTSLLASNDGNSNNDNDGKTKKKKSKSKAGKSKKKSDVITSSPVVGTEQDTSGGSTSTSSTDVDDPVPSVPVEVVPVGPIVMSSTELARVQRENELKIKNEKVAAILANTSPEGLYYGPRPRTPDILQFDVTGGRPGAIIESEDQLERRAKMMDELLTGERTYEESWFKEYGYLEQEVDAKYTTDDPDAIDADTLGQYDITDLNTKFDWEWNPETDSDPNIIIPDGGRYLTETEKDEEGIEVGYDPYFGPSNPIDERTMIGTVDSYMIDVRTRDEKMLTPQFHPGDPEIAFNEEVVQYRKSMDIIESYVDAFLPADVPVPRNVAKWYGYPEPMRYPPKNFTNNRFTEPDQLTNFDELTPYRARQRAVELARAKNAEWLPVGVSHHWHDSQRRPYENYGTLIGTLRPGKVDDEIVESIQPALKVLGSCAILLSMEGENNTVFRFHYHGLMKNRAGMEAWAETLIRDCGVDVTGVVFETGFRARDPAYDGGDPYHGWN